MATPAVDETFARESQNSSPTQPTKESKKTVEPSGQASIGGKLQLRAEVPSVPPGIVPVLPDAVSNDTATGNASYTLELKETGHLGYFLKRSNTTPAPVYVDLIVNNYFNGIKNTLSGALERYLKLKTEFGDVDVTNRVEEVSHHLTCGCCVITYLKLRAIAMMYLDDFESIQFSRPRVSADLAIPTAFAVAIQQLGLVKVADLHTDRVVVPKFPSTGHKYGIPTGHSWSANAYAKAVEYARSLGMRFNIVDLKVKQGSAWYLFRQSFSEEIFELQCIIPETNYTDGAAVVHTLFLSGDEDDPSNAIFNLSPLGTSNYGTMLNHPHRGINISTFGALSGESAEVWKNV